MGITVVTGLLVVLGGIALVFAVLGFVLHRVRASGRSASRGYGTGEGGTAYHAGTRPGPEFGSTAARERPVHGEEYRTRPDRP